MLPPKDIYRHRVALIEELGWDAKQVTAGGFTDEYIEVVGDHANGDPERRLILESNSIIRTRIPWPDDEYRERARRAMDDDFRETIGDAAYQHIQSPRALHRKE